MVVVVIMRKIVTKDNIPIIVFLSDVLIEIGYAAFILIRLVAIIIVWIVVLIGLNKYATVVQIGLFAIIIM